MTRESLGPQETYTLPSSSRLGIKDFCPCISFRKQSCFTERPFLSSLVKLKLLCLKLPHIWWPRVAISYQKMSKALYKKPQHIYEIGAAEFSLLNYGKVWLRRLQLFTQEVNISELWRKARLAWQFYYLAREKRRGEKGDKRWKVTISKVGITLML